MPGGGLPVTAVRGHQRPHPVDPQPHVDGSAGGGSLLHLGERVIPLARVEVQLPQCGPDQVNPGRARPLGQRQRLPRHGDRLGLPVQVRQIGSFARKQQQPQVSGLRIHLDHRQRPVDVIQLRGLLAPVEADVGQGLQRVSRREPARRLPWRQRPPQDRNLSQGDDHGAAALSR